MVLALSCALGWVVAKISLKLKNKDFITVLVSLVFFGVYYVFCFRIQYVLQDLIENAVRYGEKIHGAAYPLYVLGQAGSGSYPAMAAITAVSLLLFLLVWRLLSRSFLKIATSSSSSTKVRYRSHPLRAASPDKALLGKEFRRFLSSPNYMLNCGLGIILLPALGIVLLVKRAALLTALPLMSEGVTGFFAVLLAACMCAVIAMIDIAAPSVSLEGKTLWQLQSLPVDPWQPLLAKLRIQWILTLIPTLICSILAIFAFSFTVPERILILLLPLAYGIFSGMAGLSLGLKFPNLSWTNETAPIKQSASVTIALFGGWGYAIIVGGLYCLLVFVPQRRRLSGAGFGIDHHSLRAAVCLAAEKSGARKSLHPYNVKEPPESLRRFLFISALVPSLPGSGIQNVWVSDLSRESSTRNPFPYGDR